MSEEKSENSFGGRLARYARVSSTMSGLGVRMAGERYLGIKVDREKHARQLREALGGLKGPLMKVAQLLSTIPDALPQEYVQELSQLQSNAPPMRWLFVKRRMTSELGEGWEGKFKEFGKEPAAAASLGQVHRATLPDGRAVACKLQYPNMQAAVDADLAQLKVIMRLYERYDSAINTGHVYEEINERLREELDYRNEARNMAFYRAALESQPDIHVPQSIDSLTTTRLLTMSWLEGQRIRDFFEAPQEVRNSIALRLFRTWYTPFYGYGAIHGDPHLGNYTIADKDGTGVNLLDFGCIRYFPARFVGGVLDLYTAMKTDDMDLARHAYETWGFTNLKPEVMETLNIWARFVYAPVLQDRVARFDETNSGLYGRETAEKVHKRLKEVGGVTVPREFVFMDRAALGLGSVFLHLQAELNWFELFTGVVKDFSVEALETRQRDMLPLYGLPVPA